MIDLLFACLVCGPTPNIPSPPKLPPLPENVLGLPAKEAELKDTEDREFESMLKYKLSTGYIEETSKSIPLPPADKVKAKSINRRGMRNK